MVGIQLASSEGEDGASPLQPGFTFGSRGTLAVSGLHFTKMANTAARERSSALETAWDQQRMAALGRAVNPATRDPSKRDVSMADFGILVILHAYLEEAMSMQL